MSSTTTQAWNILDSVGGYLPIDAADAGAANANSGATVYPVPPSSLGKVVRAVNATYGVGEFILLKAAASTLVGSLVRYNATTWQATLNPNTANLAGPVAVAMAASTSGGDFIWHQIGGLAVIKKTAVQVAPGVAVYQSATAGRIFATQTSGKQILGAKSANLTTVTSTTSTLVVLLDRPHMQGQVT
jgi:hypothetical protein